MRKLTLSIVTAAVLLMCASSCHAPPAATIELLNPPRSGQLELAVDESYTFDVEITSIERFVVATAMTDQYYPGRGIYWDDSDRATQATSAVLHLTVTGKEPTAVLPAVCDWPEPGDCWPEGVAPASIVADVRYKGGLVVAERFSFAVVVP